uniref:Secreted protein n=1 Tax=Setaria digitata TaxID=48799 RepID=A0A915Q5A0_9BILA
MVRTVSISLSAVAKLPRNLSFCSVLARTSRAMGGKEYANEDSGAVRWAKQSQSWRIHFSSSATHLLSSLLAQSFVVGD